MINRFLAFTVKAYSLVKSQINNNPHEFKVENFGFRFTIFGSDPTTINNSDDNNINSDNNNDNNNDNSNNDDDDNKKYYY